MVSPRSQGCLQLQPLCGSELTLYCTSNRDDGSALVHLGINEAACNSFNNPRLNLVDIALQRKKMKSQP
jgi:hypothetical protein